MTAERTQKKITGIIMLTLCAFIWGTAFIAQSIGGQYTEPLTFNCGRSVLAAVFLACCCFIHDKLRGRKFNIWGSQDAGYRRQLLKGGIICGIALSSATFMQQLGIMYTSVGKSGFITALYIVLVPLFGYIAFRTRISLLQCLSVLVAAAGMYFICINESFTINIGDIYTLICAVFFAFHILCVDRFTGGLDGLRFSMVQFATCSVFNGILMFIFENPSWEQAAASILPLLYLGVMSSGVAYTLQIMGQKYVSSVIACMLMSLESAFALISGWLFLNQTLSRREIFGCVLVFAAITLAQVPAEMLFGRKKAS